MAINFTNIGLAEPSTITHKVAAVTIARGSTNEQQEILCLGDGQSSLGIAVVTDTTPASTAFGLVVREAVPQSTTVNVSSVAGAVVIRSSAANALVSVYQSTAADLNVTVAGYVPPSSIVTVSTGSVRVHQSTYTDLQGMVRLADRDQSTQVAGVTNTTPASTAYGIVVREAAPSTTVNVSSVAGAVIVRSSAANALITAYQSSAADLNVTVAGYSTTANVSSLAGRVAIAGFHATDGITNVTDSTNTAIRVNVVAGAAGGSTEVTVRQSTYTDFNTLSRLADRDNSTKVAAVLSDTQPASSAYGLVVRIPAPINDSTNNALRVNVVAGAAGGSTEVTVRQSTYTDFNTLSRLADRDQSTQVANVTNTTPASTAYALVVREAAPSTGPFAVSSIAGAVTVSSVGGIVKNQIVDRDQSTQVAAVLNAAPASTVWALAVREVAQSTGTFSISSIAGRTLVDQNSTTWPVQVSSLAGAVITRSSAADMLVTVYQSTASALNVTARLQDGTGNALESATAQTSSNARGLIVRQAWSGSTFFAASTVGNSTATTIASSVASASFYVYAYSVKSTITGSISGGFYSSNATLIWPILLASSGGVLVGDNLAVTPPAYLFRTVANEALTFRFPASSNAGVSLGVSFWVGA